jgi:sugar transferase (PEP-CTERM/EpsH1 system associated)
VSVLFLTQRVPYPPDKGDKLRAYHELRALVEQGRAVHLIAFADNADDLRQSGELQKLCETVQIVPLRRGRAAVKSVATLARPGRPLTLAYFYSAAMGQAVQRSIVRIQPRALFVCSAQMAQYVPRDMAKRTVVDLVDVDSEKWLDYAMRDTPPRAWVYKLESRRMRQFERGLLSRMGRVVVSAQREADLLLRDLGPRPDKLHVISNGVDLAYFARVAGARPPRSGNRLLFTGVMDYFPNVDAVHYYANDVLPLVRRRKPDAEFVVVGRRPAPPVRHLHSPVSGVHVVGQVPDVRPYLAQATASVAPLRIARGVQNKLLEAMASARAVVATPQAAAGIRAVDGRHLLIARDAAEFADATVQLLDDEGLRTRVGLQARQFVECEHRWAPLMREMTTLVDAVAA